MSTSTTAGNSPGTVTRVAHAGLGAPASAPATRPLHSLHLPRLALECGQVLRDVRQAYHLDGVRDAAGTNAVIVLHPLTGTADAAGDWWSEVIGPGRAIDTRRYAVIAPNLLGSCHGTGAGDDRAELPPVTTRDQARLVVELVRALGFRGIALVTGGSLGGMVALEVAASFPRLAHRTVAFAAPAAHTAWAIGWNHVQRRALATGGDAGLALAREIAMLSYRSEREFGARFGRLREEDGRFAVQSYLRHHGDKLERRFTAAAYRALTGAMDAHDVGRAREGVTAALRRVRGLLVGVGVTGDALYSEREVQAWTRAADAEYRCISSVHGHDAFLVEQAQVAAIVSEALATPVPGAGEVGPAGGGYAVAGLVPASSAPGGQRSCQAQVVA